jgi:LmbE family N-acetylglucosaminyl deacetylase
MSAIRTMVLTLVILALAACGTALAAEAADITGQCALKSTNSRTSTLTDDDLTSAWSPSGENAELRIKFPENGAGYVRIDWRTAPKSFVFLQYDADLNQIASVNSGDTYLGVSHLFPLDPDARYAALRLVDRGQKVSELKVYSAGELPDSVQNWYAPFSKADILVVAAHQGDEFACFGGLIPYYTQAEPRRVQVVYMTNGDRGDIQESLNALWTAGVMNYPEFVGLDADKPSSVKRAVSNWGGKEALVGAMVELIRKYQPDIIVTHDIEGENGDNQHAATAQALKLAVEAAGDETQYPESVQTYGVWQVKKLYTHLGSENVTVMDWTQPSEELDGKSPLDAAKAAFGEYDIKAEKNSQGDNGTFALTITGVGADAQGGDLFENVYVSPDVTGDPDAEGETHDPSGTPEPTPTPAILFSPEPTMEPTPVPGSADGFGGATFKTLIIIGGGMALMLLVSVIQALMYSMRKRGGRRRFY